MNLKLCKVLWCSFSVCICFSKGWTWVRPYNNDSNDHFNTGGGSIQLLKYIIYVKCIRRNCERENGIGTSQTNADQGYGHVVSEVQAGGDGRQVGAETEERRWKTQCECVPEKCSKAEGEHLSRFHKRSGHFSSDTRFTMFSPWESSNRNAEQTVLTLRKSLNLTT